MTNTSDSGQLRIGIVGIGSLGQRLAKQFRELEGATIRAVSDVDEEKLRTFGESISIPAPHQYTDYERMLSAEPLDAVGIATPNGLHYQQVMAALNAHLHVLCEKPLATTVEDAVALTERAERSDRTVMIGYQRHLNPAFELARDQWATGDRQARFITGEITHDWRSYFETMENWRMDPDLSGGGHLLNVGTHVIDAILWITGLTPEHVDATVRFHDEDQIFDTQSAAVISFAEGGIASVADTGIVARTREHIHIWDDEGAVYLHGREWDDRTGYVIDSEGAEHDPYFSYSRRLAKGQAFLAAVRGENPPPATVRDGLKSTLVTLAIYEAGRTGSRITVRDRYPDAASYL